MSENIEIIVSEVKALVPIKMNYEEIRQKLITMTEEYKVKTYTEEEIPLAKKDRAFLNKSKKALNDKKIEIKKMVLSAYLPFEEQVKELMLIIDDASKTVDKSISDYEEKQRDAKLKNIKETYTNVFGDLQTLVPFERIFNQVWLNQTCKIETINSEIEKRAEDIKTALSSLDELEIKDSIKISVKDEYLHTLDLTAALNKKNQLLEAEVRQQEWEADQKKKQEEAEKLVKPEPAKEEAPAPTPAPEPVTTRRKYLLELDMTEEENDRLIIFLNTNKINFVEVK